jgi:hypothetical protein
LASLKVMAPTPAKAKEAGSEDRNKRKRKRSNKPREGIADKAATLEVPDGA